MKHVYIYVVGMYYYFVADVFVNCIFADQSKSVCHTEHNSKSSSYPHEYGLQEYYMSVN